MKPDLIQLNICKCDERDSGSFTKRLSVTSLHRAPCRPNPPYREVTVLLPMLFNSRVLCSSFRQYFLESVCRSLSRVDWRGVWPCSCAHESWKYCEAAVFWCFSGGSCGLLVSLGGSWWFLGRLLVVS